MWPECNVDPIYKTKMNPASFNLSIFSILEELLPIAICDDIQSKELWLQKNAWFQNHSITVVWHDAAFPKKPACTDHLPFFVPNFLEVSLSDAGWAVRTLPTVAEIERNHCISHLHVVNKSIILTKMRNCSSSKVKSQSSIKNELLHQKPLKPKVFTPKTL